MAQDLQSKLGCQNSEDFDQDLYLNWLNISTFNNSLELELYDCAYTRYLNIKNFTNTLDGHLQLSCSLVGFLSCTLVLITLSFNKLFKSMTYFYFRLITCLEYFNMTSLFLLGLLLEFPPCFRTNYEFTWFFNCVASNIGNFASTIADLIIVFLSVERSVACLFPGVFDKINTKRMALVVCILASAISGFLCLPQVFAKTVSLNPDEGFYYVDDTEFGMSEGFVSYQYVVDTIYMAVAFAVLTTTVLVVIGVFRLRRIKKRLTTGSSTQSNQSNTSSDSVHIALQICYLQLTQAIPVTLNYVCYLVITFMNADVRVGSAAVASNIGYQKASTHLKLKSILLWVRLMLNFTNILAHNLHFFLYLAFSRRFRLAFSRRVLRRCRIKRKTPVHPIQVRHVW